MYILACRDMALPARGGATDAQLYRLASVDPAYLWQPPDVGRLVAPDPQRAKEDFRGAHVCFIIHGFNVNRDRGFAGGGAMAQELRGEGPLSELAAPKGVNLFTPAVDFFVPVLWPGDWYLPVNYPFVLPTARVVGRNLAKFLTGPSATMRRVSFFTHSFGARVLLETLKSLAFPPRNLGRYRPPPTLDTVALTAAAADADVLDSAEYAAGLAPVRRLVVVSAATDEVLTTFFPIGNFVERALWLGDVRPEAALGRDGPVLDAASRLRAKTEWFVVTDAARAANAPAIDQRHGDYMPAPWASADGLPNGWSEKRERIGSLTHRLLEGRTPDDWSPRSPIPEP